MASPDPAGIPDASQREALLASIARAVHDPRITGAMRAIPREPFVPEPYRRFAYEDGALPIGEGQTISQPSLVAMMTEALRLEGHEHVLEVGTGSGYQAALLSRLASDVVTVEVVDGLRRQAETTLKGLGLANVRVLPADPETPGAPAYAPYDAIIVSAAAPAVPPGLIEQLRLGGRIVIPVGGREAQRLVVGERDLSGLRQQALGSVRFVPLRGAGGFRDDPSASTSSAFS